MWLSLTSRNRRDDTLLTALKNSRQQLESHRIEWQEDKTSLPQATDSLKKTLQEKEEEELEGGRELHEDTARRSQEPDQEEEEEEVVYKTLLVPRSRLRNAEILKNMHLFLYN